MFLRIMLCVIGLCIAASGLGFAMQPVYTGTSMSELVLKVGKGQVVVPTPTSNRAPAKATGRAIHKYPHPTPLPASERASRFGSLNNVKPIVNRHTAIGHPARTASRNVTPAPILPPVPGISAPVNGTNVGPANQTNQSLRTLVPPELRPRTGTAPALQSPPQPVKTMPASLDRNRPLAARLPGVSAKAMYCVDCSSNRVVLAKNVSEPLPIASITKLLTAMTAIDTLDMNRVLTVPHDIMKVPRHRVGLRPGDRLTVKDLLHGMLIESGNDCAEVIARAYPNGGRQGFLEAMARKAKRIGATSARIYTPSGLDSLMLLGRKESRDLESRKPNTASARDVAVIAQRAFQYPLIREIASMKQYAMRTRNETSRNYNLVTNDKLLSRKLPVVGAKTGYTNLAGKCIVALFKNQGKEHVVVVLNTARHFAAAEKIYRWAGKTF